MWKGKDKLDKWRNMGGGEESGLGERGRMTG